MPKSARAAAVFLLILVSPAASPVTITQTVDIPITLPFGTFSQGNAVTSGWSTNPFPLGATDQITNIRFTFSTSDPDFVPLGGPTGHNPFVEIGVLNDSLARIGLASVGTNIPTFTLFPGAIDSQQRFAQVATLLLDGALTLSVGAYENLENSIGPMTLDKPSQLTITLDFTPRPLPDPAPAALSLQMPFREISGSGGVVLTTEAGGKSSDNSATPLCGGSPAGVYFDPCHKASQNFYALDFATQDVTTAGAAKVVASAMGRVIRVDRTGDYPAVTIYHGNGYATEYAEFGEILSSLHEGQTVVAGEELGTLRHGTLSSGATEHLHFQVKYNATAANKPFSDSSVSIEDFRLGRSQCAQFSSNGEVCLQGNAALDAVRLNGWTLRDYHLQLISDGSVHPVRTPWLETTPLVAANNQFSLTLQPGGAGTLFPIWIDPVLAVGYDYVVNSGPNFASVILPEIGDGQYELWLFDHGLGQYVLSQFLAHDTELFFPAGGVSRFRVTGIEASAGLDPFDPMAFVTGLTFVATGDVDLTMTPLTIIVAEPITITLLGLGLAGLGFSRRHHASSGTA